MASDTAIAVIGNLTSDPELRFTPVSGGFMNSEGFSRGTEVQSVFPQPNPTAGSMNRRTPSASHPGQGSPTRQQL